LNSALFNVIFQLLQRSGLPGLAVLMNADRAIVMKFGGEIYFPFDLLSIRIFLVRAGWSPGVMH
jgi:hypothetical protein